MHTRVGRSSLFLLLFACCTIHQGKRRNKAKCGRGEEEALLVFQGMPRWPHPLPTSGVAASSPSLAATTVVNLVSSSSDQPSEPSLTPSIDRHAALVLFPSGLLVTKVAFFFLSPQQPHTRMHIPDQVNQPLPSLPPTHDSIWGHLKGRSLLFRHSGGRKGREGMTRKEVGNTKGGCGVRRTCSTVPLRKNTAGRKR